MASVVDLKESQLATAFRGGRCCPRSPGLESIALPVVIRSGVKGVLPRPVESCARRSRSFRQTEKKQMSTSTHELTYRPCFITDPVANKVGVSRIDEHIDTSSKERRHGIYRVKDERNPVGANKRLAERTLLFCHPVAGKLRINNVVAACPLCAGFCDTQGLARRVEVEPGRRGAKIVAKPWDLALFAHIVCVQA